MGLDPHPPSTCVHLSLTPLPPPCGRHKWMALTKGLIFVAFKQRAVRLFNYCGSCIETLRLLSFDSRPMHCSGVTRGAGARGQGILTAPPEKPQIFFPPSNHYNTRILRPLYSIILPKFIILRPL